MVLTNVPLVSVTAVPAVGTTGHGLPLPSSLCTLPSGQNSSVDVAPNATDVGRRFCGPSWFGRVSGFPSPPIGYDDSLHRSRLTSTPAGTDGVPMSSTMRYSPDRKSTRLNSSHLVISYAVFCLKKKKTTKYTETHLS